MVWDEEADIARREQFMEEQTKTEMLRLAKIRQEEIVESILKR